MYEIQLPGATGVGASAPAVNIATMSNSGIDMSFAHRGSLSGGELGYEVTLNASTLKNEIVSLAPGITYFGGNTYLSLIHI